MDRAVNQLVWYSRMTGVQGKRPAEGASGGLECQSGGGGTNVNDPSGLGHTSRFDYPTSDGKPMAETDLHRQDMGDVIQAPTGSLCGRSERLCFGKPAAVL